jgi:hypothetical protein
MERRRRSSEEGSSRCLGRRALRNGCSVGTKGGEAAYAARTVGRWETGGKAPEAAGAAGPSVLNRLGRREDGAGVAVGWTLPKATGAAQEGKAVARERLSAREERASQLDRDEVEEEEETVESPLAGGRKRRVEEPERSGTRGKSPRGEEEEEGLFDYNEERDGVGEVSGSDEDMLGQD